MDANLLEQIEKWKLLQESLKGMVQTSSIEADALASVLSGVEEAMQKNGMPIHFNFSYDASKSKGEEDPLTQDIGLLTNRLQRLEEETSVLYTMIGDVQSYTDEKIVALAGTRDALARSLRQITTDSAYKEMEKNIVSLEAEYENVKKDYEHILEEKITGNEQIRASIDFAYLRELPSHSIEQVRTMGDSLLQLYREDRLVQGEVESIADAITQGRKLNFYKESVDKIKQEVSAKEKAPVSLELYQGYHNAFTGFVQKIEVALTQDDLSDIQKDMDMVFEKYYRDRETFSAEQRQELESLMHQGLDQMIEKKSLMVFGNYKKLDEYAQSHRLDRQRVEDTEKAVQTSYHDNTYDYYNLNKVSEEVAAYNAQKEAQNNTTTYKDNMYAFYDMNEVAKQVAAYNQNQNGRTVSTEGQDKGPATPKWQQEVESYVQSPLAFFTEKAKEIQMDITLNSLSIEKLLATVEAYRQSFENHFMGPDAVYDVNDLDRVRESLLDANKKIESDKILYTKQSEANPYFAFERFKKEVQRDRSLDVEGIREMLQYINQLQEQFTWSFASHGATLDVNNKEQVEQYMQTVQKLIEDKKNMIRANSTISHTR